MSSPTRMSPLTAFFIGLFMLGSLFVASITVVALYSLSIFENNVGRLVDVAGGALEDLPETLNKLDPILSKYVGERSSGYAKKVLVTAQLSPRPGTNYVRAALQIANQGDQPIRYMTVRVVALNEQKIPVSEWTEVVATPIAIENDWRGPLEPNQTRYVLLHGSIEMPEEHRSKITLVHEIVDVFVPGETELVR